MPDPPPLPITVMGHPYTTWTYGGGISTLVHGGTGGRALARIHVDTHVPLNQRKIYWNIYIFIKYVHIDRVRGVGGLFVKIPRLSTRGEGGVKKWWKIVHVVYGWTLWNLWIAPNQPSQLINFKEFEEELNSCK